MPRPRPAGFAMLDVLVALLLLAITLSGACVTLLQTMRVSHGALLATRAVDLAADLAEQLRDATTDAEVEALLDDWRVRVADELPVTGMAAGDVASLTSLPAAEGTTPEAAPRRRELVLRWQSAQGEMRELRLPVVIGAQ